MSSTTARCWRAAMPAPLADCLRALLRHGRVVLSGRGRRASGGGARGRRGAAAAQRARRRGWTCRRLGPGADALLASLSANTRQQLRRSDRGYAAIGPARRCGGRPTLAEALAFLDALAVLHQARWTARGQPGAFANPASCASIAPCWRARVPRGEAELLRVSAGER